jgi:hypothetical protein
MPKDDLVQKRNWFKPRLQRFVVGGLVRLAISKSCPPLWRVVGYIRRDPDGRRFEVNAGSPPTQTALRAALDGALPAKRVEDLARGERGP